MANKVIGKRIKERREALKMSQADLAEKIGYSGKTAVSKIERSVNDVKPKTLVKIAEALHTSVVYLMGLSDAPKKHIFSDFFTQHFTHEKKTARGVWRSSVQKKNRF